MTHRELPILKLRLFKPNQTVRHEGYMRVVEYVHIAKGELFVKLNDVPNLVPEYKIDCELTTIDFNLPYVLKSRNG